MTQAPETLPTQSDPGDEPAGVISDAEERFERWRKRAGIVLAPLGFALTYSLAADLGPQARTLAAILVVVCVFWTTEIVPLPVTALFGATLCIVLGVAPAKQVLAHFADPIIFLFIGSFILARAMTVHHLDRRIALSFLSVRWFAAHPARMLGGMGLITAVISMWVSNTASTAMMLPIALGILGALHRVRVAAGLTSGPMSARSWPFAAGMMLMIPYAASIGGIGTPVGSPPNLIGIGLIRRATGVEITFLQWMALCVPLLAVMGASLFALLYWLHPADRRPRDADAPAESTTSSMAHYVREERARLGPMTRGELNTLIAFALAIVLWVLPGVLALPLVTDIPGASKAAAFLNARFPEAVAALLAAVLLFVLPVNLAEGRMTLTWPEAAKIDWGTILLFGGGLAFGTLAFDTGVAHALGRALTSHLGVSSMWTLTFVAVALGIVLSEATSNTAAANMLVPVVIGICQTAGISPIPPALGAVLGASYGFMLPVSTAPNAIAYGSGLIPLPAMIRAGAVFDLLGLFIIWTGLRILCPLLGLS